MKRTTALTSAVLTLAAFAVAGCSGIGSTTYGESKTSQSDSSQSVASADANRPAMSDTASGSSTQTAVRIEAPNKSGDKSSASMVASSGVGGEVLREAMAYPTGDKKSSVLLIEKIGPKQVRIGQPYAYQIKVTNLTDGPLAGVIVREKQMENFQIKQAQPSAEKVEGQNQWAIGEIAAKGSKTIEVSGTPDKPGALNSCIGVTYSPTLCTTAMVINPSLRLSRETPKDADICQTINAKYTITNTGTGAVNNAKIEEALPDGLMTAEGQPRVSIDVGTLTDGQSRSFTVPLKAKRGGDFNSKATATASDGLQASSDPATTSVKAPKLEVVINAPEQEYLNQNVNYEVVVKNTGNATAKNATLRIDRAAGDVGGARQASAVMGGDPLGTLEPGASKSVKLSYNAKAEGALKMEALASDPCAGATRAVAQTMIKTIPALMLEAVDKADPVRVGENTTYTINVKNQGTGPDKNIKLVVTLPEGEQYIGSKGPTNAQASGQKITFAPLPTLAPGQTAAWTVEIKATKAADVRFKVEMTSDSLPFAAEKLEPTRLY